MANEKTVITVNLDMFDKDADAKTAEANKVAKNLGISDEALAKVEDFKQELTDHDAWDLPFIGLCERGRLRIRLRAGRGHHHASVLGRPQGVHESAG